MAKGHSRPTPVITSTAALRSGRHPLMRLPLEPGSLWLAPDRELALWEWACVLEGLEPYRPIPADTRPEYKWLRALKEARRRATIEIATDCPHHPADALVSRKAIEDFCRRIDRRPPTLFPADEGTILEELKRALPSAGAKSAIRMVARKLNLKPQKIVQKVYDEHPEIHRSGGRPSLNGRQ